MDLARESARSDVILDEVRRHDAALRARGLELWIGAEPTFTRRDSQESPWLFEAEGADKEERARMILRALAPRLDGRVQLLRVVGRQYPDEPQPRFCFGALWPRQPDSPAPPIGGASLDGPPAPAPAVEGAAWLTVTPDPGVVEVNMAPAPDLETFLHWSRAVYAAAAEAGLAPERYRFNGEAADSGGGGQITLGGPSPERSPFLLHRGLLPGMLRYLNRHPSLSYWFATECVGSAGQGPRPDEGVRERFDELALALDRIESSDDIDLWEALAPLLVDCAGNSHRAELNVEKLWNPHLAGRGRLGVVELRALRMPRDAERMVAVGALLRAIAGRIVASPYREPMLTWGAELHDRFALPWFLAADLARVLDDLDAHGLGPGPALRALLVEPRAPVARVPLSGATLAITPALEFWPLVGDVASQERRGSRMVDASSARLELLVEAPAGEGPGSLRALGRSIPFASVAEGRYLAAVRYRAFVPRPGLHPGLGAVDPLVLTWSRGGEAVQVALHGWIPGGGVYDGLPADGAEAARRRRERVVITAAEPITDERAAGPATGGAYTVDLRRPDRGQ